MESALSDVERSVELNPGDFDGQMSLASLLFSMQKHDRAAAVWEQLVQRYPDHHRSHHLQLNLAIVRREQGRLAEALTHVNRSLELSPDSEEVKKLREDIQQRMAKASENIHQNPQ